MSIILEGIDMPKEGEHIVTLIKSNGKCSYWKQDTEYGICEPMQTVKAIQIPTPHGRLIDIDKVKDELRDQIPCCGLDMTYSNSNAFDTMDNAPTILEAER